MERSEGADAGDGRRWSFVQAAIMPSVQRRPLQRCYPGLCLVCTLQRLDTSCRSHRRRLMHTGAASDDSRLRDIFLATQGTSTCANWGVQGPAKERAGPT